MQSEIRIILKSVFLLNESKSSILVLFCVYFPNINININLVLTWTMFFCSSLRHDHVEGAG